MRCAIGHLARDVQEGQRQGGARTAACRGSRQADRRKTMAAALGCVPSLLLMGFGAISACKRPRYDAPSGADAGGMPATSASTAVTAVGPPILARRPALTMDVYRDGMLP